MQRKEVVNRKNYHAFISNNYRMCVKYANVFGIKVKELSDEEHRIWKNFRNEMLGYALRIQAEIEFNKTEKKVRFEAMKHIFTSVLGEPNKTTESNSAYWKLSAGEIRLSDHSLSDYYKKPRTKHQKKCVSYHLVKNEFVEDVYWM